MAATKEREFPKKFADYKVWLRQKKKFDYAYSQREYDFVQAAFERELINSDIWKMLYRNLGDYSQDYYVKTGLELLHRSDETGPPVLRKSFESFLEKTYRYSFIKVAAPPASDADVRSPHEYFGEIDDVLRSLIVVKFLDGVEFVIRKLDALCNACQIERRVEYKNNEQGYFAAHYYILIPVTTTLPNRDAFSRRMPFELQITTQLQEVLRRFLHFEYERNRAELHAPPPLPWQWRYRDHEFFSNYLGHMIRSIEGQIMDVRRRRDIADACAE